jgi:hypothetical protein
MAVWYLDDEDEITEAVARLRGATEEQVVFVVPPGSRIATGRINFKLLGREAAARGLQIAIASPDGQVRAMASSAGLLGLATAAEAQAALRRGDLPAEPSEVGSGAETTDGASAEAVEAGPGAVAGRSRWTGRRLAAGVAVVLIVAGAGVVASLQTLPTAEITLTPRTVAVGPLQLTITALPTVSEPDAASGRIPALEVPIPLRVEGTFRASGSQRVESQATGSVIFSAPAQGLTGSVEIRALTPVFTSDGVEFRTTETVTLEPPVEGESNAQVTAPIEAARPGSDGNVPVGAIDRVPSLAAQAISVSNAEATSGGRLEETPVVTREDVEAAAVDLENRLAGELAARLRDPGSAPDGLTLYPETADPGDVRHEPPVDELVGTEASDFRLSGAIDAQVLAVDESLVAELAEAALDAEVPDGLAILPGGLSIDVSPGVPEGEGITFHSTARASAYQSIDDEAVLARIAGLPVSEARAILEDIGATTVSVWPEFLGDLPGDPGRIRLLVLEPSSTE